jgi:hypothetical protein
VLGLTEPVAGMFSLLSCFSRFLSFRHLLLFHVQRSNIKVVVTYLWYLSLKLFHLTDEETKRDINKKLVYLLEGLPGSKLVKGILKREKIDENLDETRLLQRAPKIAWKVSI